MSTKIHQNNSISSCDEDEPPLRSRRLPRDDPTMAVDTPKHCRNSGPRDAFCEDAERF